MSELKSLANGLRALDALMTGKGGIRASEVASQLGVNRSAAGRIMQTLVAYQFAEQDQESKKYTLAARLRLGSEATELGIPLRAYYRPLLKTLVRETGEGAHLAVLSGNRAHYIDHVSTESPLKVDHPVGTRSPLHCTALGKVFLAFGDAAIPAEMPAHTHRTIVDSEAMESELRQIRKNGYAVDDEEFEYGVRCIALPLYGPPSSDSNKPRRLLAACGISGPSTRIQAERIRTLAEDVMRIARAADQ